MRASVRALLVAAIVAAAGGVLAAAAAAAPPMAAEATSTFDYTKNMKPLGFSPRSVPIDNTVPGQGVFNSDLAFWGTTAVQGT